MRLKGRSLVLSAAMDVRMALSSRLEFPAIQNPPKALKEKSGSSDRKRSGRKSLYGEVTGG